MIVTWWITRGAITRFCERKMKKARENTEVRKETTQISSPYALHFIHVSRDYVAYILLFLSVINRHKFGEEQLAAGQAPFEIISREGEPWRHLNIGLIRKGSADQNSNHSTRGVFRDGVDACRPETAIFAYAPPQNPSDAHELPSRVSEVP